MVAAVASSPVRSHSACRASVRQTAAASSPKPSCLARMASASASRARVAAESWRALQSCAAPGSSCAVPSRSATASVSACRPTASFAHIGTIFLKYGSNVPCGTSCSPARSCLFSTAIAGRPLHLRASSRSSSDSGCAASNTASTRPASSSFFQLRRIPSASMASPSAPTSRTPAVSNRFSRTLPSCTACSTISRVVPATGVTMARSKPASRFKSVLLPTLGRPSSTQSTPWRSTAPAL